MNLDQKEYKQMVENRSKPTKLLPNCFKAFLAGGIICIIAQIYHDLLPFEEDIRKIHTTVFMVFLGSLLTALNVYDDIGKFGGAGASVPITGFSNSIVSPAMEFKKEGYVMGVGAKMFLIAGPVLVYGIFASVAGGLLYFIWKQVM